MRFSGCCVFAFGGAVWLAIFLCTVAALVSTTYSVSSCRLFVVDFVSDSGNFEETFNKVTTIENINVNYKVSVGLFQWLQPLDGGGGWNEGNCVGYQETMRSVLSDTYFDVGRICGVLSTLLGCLQVLWVLVLSCLEMNPIQAWIFCGLSLMTSAFSSLTFLFYKSSLCQSLFVEQTCTLDEGGLVLIAGAILWLVSFCLVYWFVLPEILHSSPQQQSTKSSTRSQRQVDWRHQRTLPRNYSFDSSRSWTTPRPKQPSKQKVRPVVMDSTDPNAMEVYVKRRLDRIDRLADV